MVTKRVNRQKKEGEKQGRHGLCHYFITKKHMERSEGKDG